MREDHLFIEPLLIDFLKSKEIEGVRAVYGVGDLSRIGEVAITSPCLQVMYYGDEMGGSVGGGKLAKVNQKWLVLVAVDCGKNPVSGAGARASAGRIIAQVINAMAGETLFEGGSPMKRVSGGQPKYSGGTLSYFPLVFEIGFISG